MQTESNGTIQPQSAEDSSRKPLTEKMLLGIESYLPALLLFAALLLVSVGFRQGDVRPSEAELLLGGSTNPYALLLQDGLRILGLKHHAILFARGLSVAGLLLGGTILYCWLRSSSGSNAAYSACVAFACGLPSFILGTEASPQPLLLVGLLGLAWSINQISLRLMAVVWCTLAIAFGCIVYWIAPAVREASWITTADDPSLAPFYAILWSLPWSIGIALCVSRDFWFTLSTGEQKVVATSLILGATALVGSYFYPGGWLAAATLCSLAGIVPLAITLEQRIGNRATLTVTAQHASLLTLLVLGIPLTAILAGGIRIGVYHQQMEKVQALVIVGIVALILGMIALKRKSSPMVWVPVVAVAISAKILYLTAFIPEWNIRESKRPFAHAVATHMEDGAPLYADVYLGPDFEYYLGRSTAALTDLRESSAGPRFALVTPKDFRALEVRSGRQWQLVRQYCWSAGEPLWLAREIVPTMQASADKG